MVTLVLLPGMDGTGDLFRGFVAALPPDVPSIVVSYPPDQALDYAALEAIVRTRLPRDRAFVLLGESFSGPIAVAIAASPPPGLRGVILCCSFVRRPTAMLRVLRPLAALVPVRAVPGTVVARALLGRFGSPALRRELAAAMARVSSPAFRARLRAIDGVDARAELARVRVPVLCLRATEDRVVPHAATRPILAALPGARIVDVEGPHLLLQSAPDAAAREIAAFLRTVAT